jgi:SRSO17 transposase
MVGLASQKGYGLVDFNLYMPNRWFEDDFEDKRKQCCVPEELEFRTKNEILLSMIQQLVNSGRFKGKYVGVDSAFGRDHGFLDALPANLVYFADVPCNHQVFVGRPEMVEKEYLGRGRRPQGLIPSYPTIEVREIADDDSFPWQEVVLGMGTKGPICTRDKWVKVVENRDGVPGQDVWLYMRQIEDGSIKYALCNESMEADIASIRKASLMRWSIEQCFKECKDYLGMDHFELRTWHGWRRHILVTLICQLFITKMRQEFSVTIDTPAPAPFIDEPVLLDDYLDAAQKLENGEEISHEKIHPVPQGKQSPMTIGLLIDIFNHLTQKLNNIFKKVDFKLKSMSDAFLSFCRSKVKRIKLSKRLSGSTTS